MCHLCFPRKLERPNHPATHTPSHPTSQPPSQPWHYVQIPEAEHSYRNEVCNDMQQASRNIQGSVEQLSRLLDGFASDLASLMSRFEESRLTERNKDHG